MRTKHNHATCDDTYRIIRDTVQAHHDRGTPRHVAQRALTEIAADDRAPLIDQACLEVYGDSFWHPAR